MSVRVYWDVDGTLLANWVPYENLFATAVTRVTGVPVDASTISRHGKTDLQLVRDHMRLAGVSSEREEEVVAELHALSKDRYRTGVREPLPGVPDALQYVAVSGHTNLLLTGNSAERARIKLASAGVDQSWFDWDASKFGDTADVCTDLAVAAAADVTEADARGLIVGETPADAECAYTAGLHFLGVCTGVFGPADFADFPDVAVVSDLDAGKLRFRHIVMTLAVE